MQINASIRKQIIVRERNYLKNMENSFDRNKSQAKDGGRLVRRSNGEIMTYLKTLGILCPNQVADQGWRVERRGGERHRKRSTNHLSSNISLGVKHIIATGVVTHLSKTSKFQEGQGPCLIHFPFLLYQISIFSLVLVTFNTLSYWSTI